MELTYLTNTGGTWIREGGEPRAKSPVRFTMGCYEKFFVVQGQVALLCINIPWKIVHHRKKGVRVI